MAHYMLTSRQEFDVLPFNDQTKIKQTLLKKIFPLVIKISPEYLGRFSEHLNGRTHQTLLKHRRIDNDESVMEEMFLTLQDSLVRSPPWWEVLEEILQEQQYDDLYRALNPWEEDSTPNDLTADCAPDPPPNSCRQRDGGRCQTNPQRNAAQSQERAVHQAATPPIYIREAAHVQIGTVPTHAEARPGDPADPDDLSSRADERRTFPGSAGRRDVQATVQEPGRLATSGEISTSETSARLSSTASSPAPWDGPAHETDVKQVVAECGNDVEEDGASAGDELPNNRQAPAAGIRDGGVLGRLKKMLKGAVDVYLLIE